MGIFSGLFGGAPQDNANSTGNVPWIPLNKLLQLEDIKQKSIHTPQVIFKHSTRCGVSRLVLNGFNASYDIEPEKLDLYFLDLLAYRAISDEVSSTFGVVHQSPQLLIIKNGKVVAHDSHGGINELSLHDFV